MCDGPFPIAYSKISRSLATWRGEKYKNSPTSCAELRAVFEDPKILKDLGTSLQRDHGVLFNCVHEEDSFAFCVISSPKSVELITQNVEEKDLFYLIDATFSITPMCNVFQQVLIIHAQFGIKVDFNFVLFESIFINLYVFV